MANLGHQLSEIYHSEADTLLHPGKATNTDLMRNLVGPSLGLNFYSGDTGKARQYVQLHPGQGGIFKNQHNPNQTNDDTANLGAFAENRAVRNAGRAVGDVFAEWGAGVGTNALGGGNIGSNLMGRAINSQSGTSSSGGASGGATDIFDFAQNHYQPSTTSQNQAMLGTDPNLYNANVEKLKDQGRNGDDQLVHMSSGELNALKSTGGVTQNPNTGLPEAFSLGSLFSGGGGGSGLLGPIAGLIGNNQNKQDLTGIANTASNASNPLAAGQRQQYQQQLSDLMGPNGGANFLANDPTVQAQKKMISDQMMADFGKSGNMPLTGIMGSAQLANAFGGQYNQRIQDLTTLGGFNQGNPYGGMPYSSLIQPVNAQNQGVLAGFGSLMPGLANGLQGLFSGGGGSFGGGPNLAGGAGGVAENLGSGFE